jgi:hypothetical protein
MMAKRLESDYAAISRLSYLLCSDSAAIAQRLCNDYKAIIQRLKSDFVVVAER